MPRPPFSLQEPERAAAVDRRSLLRRLAAAGWVGSAGWAAWRPASAQYRVEIGGIGANQIPIAIARLRDEARAPQPVSAIVRADLERSGLFRVSDAGVELDETRSLVAAEWRSRGIDAVLAGSVARLADGRFDVRYALTDAVKGSVPASQSLVVAPGDLRMAAHRIADAIVKALLGEEGVFATRIAYVTAAGGRYTLRIADADGEGGSVALNSLAPVISPAWSPDGRQLAYVSFESGKAAIVVQDVASGARRVVAAFRGSNSAPAWSPDGRRLIATLSRDGGSQLYQIDLEGGAPRRLTQSGSIDTEPVFAPDGRAIYFVSDRSGGPQVYRQPVSGGAAERVTFQGSYNISPAVSPDGKLLAWVTRDNGFRLMLGPIDGSAGQRLTDTNADESPSFAPNGKLIAYATRVGGRDALMTTTLDGRVRTRLASSAGEVREPAWGPFAR